MTDKSPDALVGPPDWNKRPHLESREQFLERTADYWRDKSERLQGELQDERAKLRAARAELGMVRGKCDRLRELLMRWVAVCDLSGVMPVSGDVSDQPVMALVRDSRAALQEQGDNIP